MALAALSFTKLVVDDLEESKSYYQSVFGLSEVFRMSAHICGEPVDEIILGVDGAMEGGIVLLKWLDRPAAPAGELILGFVSDDIHALFERGVAAGGSIVGDIRDPEMEGLAFVGFLADPRGHLSEVIQRA